MADDQRVYSDEEFAAILRTAAELSRTGQPGALSDGLTLAEMKAAAAQAGLDPELVERAAQSLTTRAVATPFERLIGGPLRHEHETRFRVTLDEQRSARLLASVRIIAAHFHSVNDGQSSALGMTWKAAGAGDVVSIVARPDGDATSVSVVIDRRGTFVLTGVLSAVSVFFLLVLITGIAGEAPAAIPWVLVGGLATIITTVRSFWARSSKRARDRIGKFFEGIGQTLNQVHPTRRDAETLDGRDQDKVHGR